MCVGCTCRTCTSVLMRAGVCVPVPARVCGPEPSMCRARSCRTAARWRMAPARTGLPPHLDRTGACASTRWEGYGGAEVAARSHEAGGGGEAGGRHAPRRHLQPEREAVRSARVVDVVEGDVPERLTANVPESVGRGSLSCILSCMLRVLRCTGARCMLLSQHQYVACCKLVSYVACCKSVSYVVRCTLHVAHHIVRADRWESECDRIDRGCAKWRIARNMHDAAQSMARATVDVQHATCIDNMRHEACNKRRALLRHTAYSTQRTTANRLSGRPSGLVGRTGKAAPTHCVTRSRPLRAR